jgi:hypothetical protein
MSKISKSLTPGSIGKFELHLVLISDIETSKVNVAREVNKSEKQILNKGCKNISSNVGKLGRFLDWLRTGSPVLFACGVYNFCVRHCVHTDFRKYRVIPGKM